MDKQPQPLLELIADEFGHDFTKSQARAAEAIACFLEANDTAGQAFVLTGYAGTGKTSLVGAIVRAYRRKNFPVVLLAPTGRAAKVFGSIAHEQAYTIHHTIYRMASFEGEKSKFVLRKNQLRSALFIVDEASMISTKSDDWSMFNNSLLTDFVKYLQQGEACRLLLVGDTAQLPPVGEDESGALKPDVLQVFGLTARRADLTEVVRQAECSDVLTNATQIRQYIAEQPNILPPISLSEQGEVRPLPGSDLIEALNDAYACCGTNGTIIVTRSNRRANCYNMGIRTRLFDRGENPVAGDLVMVVKNNYYWPEQIAKTLHKGDHTPFDFIANGDMAEIVKIGHMHDAHGFTFADATVRFPDYDNFEFDCRLLISTLYSESPALNREEREHLFRSVEKDYAHISYHRKRMKSVMEDPYFNALQVKFAYAVTCHKAQGGQWERVFVDQGWQPPGRVDREHLRWLYTAFTRTTDRLYLVNWPTLES